MTPAPMMPTQRTPATIILKALTVIVLRVVALRVVALRLITRALKERVVTSFVSSKFFLILKKEEESYVIPKERN